MKGYDRGAWLPDSLIPEFESREEHAEVCGIAFKGMQRLHTCRPFGFFTVPLLDLLAQKLAGRIPDKGGTPFDQTTCSVLVSHTRALTYIE